MLVLLKHIPVRRRDRAFDIWTLVMIYDQADQFYDLFPWQFKQSFAKSFTQSVLPLSVQTFLKPVKKNRQIRGWMWSIVSIVTRSPGGHFFIVNLYMNNIFLINQIYLTFNPLKVIYYSYKAFIWPFSIKDRFPQSF